MCTPCTISIIIIPILLQDFYRVEAAIQCLFAYKRNSHVHKSPYFYHYHKPYIYVHVIRHNEFDSFSLKNGVNRHLCIVCTHVVIVILFTARPHCSQCPSAVIARGIPSVCSSVRTIRSGIVSRRMKIRSCGFYRAACNADAV